MTLVKLCFAPMGAASAAPRRSTERRELGGFTPPSDPPSEIRVCRKAHPPGSPQIEGRALSDKSASGRHYGVWDTSLDVDQSSPGPGV